MRFCRPSQTLAIVDDSEISVHRVWYYGTEIGYIYNKYTLLNLVASLPRFIHKILSKNTEQAINDIRLVTRVTKILQVTKY